MPDPVHLPHAYPVSERALVNFVNTWIDLKKKDGTTVTLYDHWILGKDTYQKLPRWSIIRDVLHWMEGWTVVDMKQDWKILYPFDKS